MRAPLTRQSLVLVALGTLLTLALPARADTWKQVLRKADKACDSEHPETAFPLYEEAIKAGGPPPEVHLAHGECLLKLGKCDEAIQKLKSFVQEARSRRSREQGEMLIKHCEEQLQAEDDARKVAEAAAASAPASQAGAREQPADLLKPAVAPRPPPPRTRRHLRPLYFWTGVGVTAALLVVGTATGVVALQKSSRFKDLGTPVGELWDLKNSGETLRLTSTITFAVGGAAAIATTVLFFYTRFKPAETVSAAPVPGGAVVVLGGHF